MENNLLFIVSSINLILGISFVVFFVIPIMLLIALYYIWGPQNKFVTFGRENRAMFVMLGEKFTGKVILPSLTNYIEKNYDICELKNLTSSERKGKKNKSFLGMYWIGIWPFYKLYTYNLQWQEWKLDTEKNDFLLVSRDELTPYLIITPFEYAMILQNAEDRNSLQVTIKFTIIIKPVNATRPIFEVEKSYGVLQRIVLKEALLYVKTETFETLGGGNINQQELLDRFSVKIIALNKKRDGDSFPGIEDFLGYTILGVNINATEINGVNKELLEATTARYVAEKKGEAIIAEAGAQKKAEILIAEGKKEAGMLNLDVIQRSYELIDERPYAQEIELTKKMFTESNLHTLVSGKDVIPTIEINKKKEEES